MPDPAKTVEGTPPAGGQQPWTPPAAEADSPAEESLYPYPEVLADWEWLFSEIPTERFNPYRGHFVAVFEKKVLGSGDDAIDLRQSVAAEHGLDDPDRLVITFVEGLDPPASEIDPWPASQ
jgi:hypothetical protein